MSKTRPCPYCATPSEAEWLTTIVGEVRSGPYRCPECGAYELSPFDPSFTIPDGEMHGGWFRAAVKGEHP